MKLLLDTHAFLWFTLGDDRCSPAARKAIEDPLNQSWISPAAHWEIAIKIRLGRYSLPGDFEAFVAHAVNVNGFRILAIEPKHTAPLTTLPLHHRDPFDRLIIAQAIVEQMIIVSADEALDAYPIARIW